MNNTKPKAGAIGRRRTVLGIFFLLMSSLIIRAAYLQVNNYKFLSGEGDARHNRLVVIPAHRGSIFDRNGSPLAVSTPIDTITAEPRTLAKSPEKWSVLAEILDVNEDSMAKLIEKNLSNKKSFMYLKRHVKPVISAAIERESIPGVSVQKEYARYYPAAEAAAQLVGFTNIDDKGVEGLELAYDSNWLKGKKGKRRIVKDSGNQEIESLGVVDKANPGKDLFLSIDKRLQYLAYSALDEAVVKHKASSGSLIVMDVSSGEVLAMTNAPSYNPNDRNDRNGSEKRNRAVIDQFEPGSTIKPFTVAAALETGVYDEKKIVYTSPGYYRIGKYDIRDSRDYGWLTVRGILKKSSNVGIVKVAEEIDQEKMWSVFDQFGFGRPPGSEFPGEVAGTLNHSSQWHGVEQSALAYGYGMAVSALQLARAYSALANDGVMPHVSFVRKDSAEEGVRVVSKKVANQVLAMLETVVSKGGTGTKARVVGYRVAGKTGTSHRSSSSGGYEEDRYISLFAGMAPVTNPKVVVVIVIHDPSAGEYYGGEVAAPVFAEVMEDALRIRGIRRDDWSSLSAQVTDTVELKTEDSM